MKFVEQFSFKWHTVQWFCSMESIIKCILQWGSGLLILGFSRICEFEGKFAVFRKFDVFSGVRHPRIARNTLVGSEMKFSDDFHRS